MEKTLLNLEELHAEAGDFARTITNAEDHATLVTLSGELGAGKTSFTQGLARELGVEESITSPTFVLEKVYELNDQKFSVLVHIDAYRLEGEHSLVPLNFSELYKNPINLIVLEWPEQVQNQLPTPDHTISLSVLEKGRLISYG